MKANKTTRPTPRAVANTLKDEKQKAKAADKGADKKVLTRKSDGLSVKNVSRSSLIKTKSSSVSNKQNDKPASKKNVMSLITNVTVVSPPSSATKERSASTSDIKKEAATLKHARTRTRTIDPKDSILHKTRLMESVQAKSSEPVKDPVAFEINFEEAKKINKPEEADGDDYNYESDFESYESDFEPEVPSTSSSSEKLQESSDELDNELTRDDKPNEQLAKLDKERIDSGSFDLSLKKPITPSSAHYDSIDDAINSHDSGISYDDLKQTLSPKLFSRGRELMKKITFDELNFEIFEAKPMPYETFMALYGGQMDMFQVSTQCEATTAVNETQTDAIRKTETWTQFPAKFTKSGLEAINSKLYNEEKLGVGDGDAQEPNAEKKDAEQFTQHIDAINNFFKSEEVALKPQVVFDSIELQKFVERAAMTVANVLDNQSKHQELKPSRISISRGFSQIKFKDVEILRDTIIKKLYSNPNVANFLVSVHKKIGEQQNLVCLWDVLNAKRPLKVFSSWSAVQCIEMHDQQSDVIVGGQSDGTISLWDTQEFPEWKEENESMSTIRPCEIISLNRITNNFALDNAVALKSLPNREHKSRSSMFTQSQASQICSLHRNGTIIIWTISRVQTDETVSKSAELDYTHSKSRVKLIKNVTIDLNLSPSSDGKENGRRKSAFEKTRYYFENDLFSDKVLRELQEIDSSRLSKAKSQFSDDQTMRCLNVNLNEIFVASDLNFIMAVSRLNLGDKTRKIITNNSSFIAPTSLQMHPMDKSILVVGQANGEVKFIKLYDDENNYQSSSKAAGKSADTFRSDLLAKSCAFQNIVENEKKLYDEAINNLESDDLKAFLVNEALSEQFIANQSDTQKLKVAFDKNIFNSFEVSPGAVTTIEFNKSGEFMFILVGRQLRIFNCWSNVEVEQLDKTRLRDVKCVQADSAEYLVLLTTDNEILVNKLKH